MGECKQTKSACTSVFKEGSSTTKSQFTKKWIELINRIEKGKSMSFSA